MPYSFHVLRGFLRVNESLGEPQHSRLVGTCLNFFVSLEGTMGRLPQDLSVGWGEVANTEQCMPVVHQNTCDHVFLCSGKSWTEAAAPSVPTADPILTALVLKHTNS
eukprot:5356799-Amphidinium_carterae.1